MNKKFNFRLIWAAFMVIAYVGISYLVVFTPILIRYNATDNEPSNDENFTVRVALGLILLVYGVFRGYRLWKVNK